MCQSNKYFIGGFVQCYILPARSSLAYSLLGHTLNLCSWAVVCINWAVVLDPQAPAAQLTSAIYEQLWLDKKHMACYSELTCHGQ